MKAGRRNSDAPRAKPDTRSLLGLRWRPNDGGFQQPLPNGRRSASLTALSLSKGGSDGSSWRPNDGGFQQPLPNGRGSDGSSWRPNDGGFQQPLPNGRGSDGWSWRTNDGGFMPLLSGDGRSFWECFDSETRGRSNRSPCPRHAAAGREGRSPAPRTAPEDPACPGRPANKHG